MEPARKSLPRSSENTLGPATTETSHVDEVNDLLRACRVPLHLRSRVIDGEMELIAGVEDDAPGKPELLFANESAADVPALVMARGHDPKDK